MTTRRDFLRNAGATALAAGLASRAQAGIPEAMIQDKPGTQGPRHPVDGPSYHPVVTLNGWTLPYRMKDGVKEFHLVAEPVVRELAPGMTAHMWGYNGQSPGPTLECVEGDRVRIFVTNKLPEHTTIHWHGIRLPSGMDGVGGLSQPQIKPGQTYVYEFTLKRSGTFMYHPHADEMVQMAMGMMGFFVVHPKNPDFMRVDRDFVFLLSAYDIEPGSYTPKVSTMTDFNLWTFNSRVFPGIDPLVARSGERVRIRVGNLTMTNHPIHLHGHDFEVTGTDGGWVPRSARWPEVTTDVAVGQMRAVEFTAEAGDWAFHCHKSHHTMNAMGHGLPTMIGVRQDDIAEKIRKLTPDFMGMGSAGMADMAEMDMPLPDNTLPMMSGQGPFGPLEMGGMFTVLKVRDNQPLGDYRDPGWYTHPEGTVARLYTGEEPATVRADAPPVAASDLRVRKPGGHMDH
ncbi:secreted protein [Fluviicoccus keumensis]|uniref:Secreted protein n=1 Tax=Fluviicoccus keumensis TaxID=1435465 RepID=A0A4Q7Z4Y5_9GAMM|nr:copper oxidase [Fluviicoccus keumensis]RZU45358.1 secreted protein [Fluviicoccus keumensis]